MIRMLLPGARSASEDAEWADVVVTMGCGDDCPYIPGKRHLNWDLEAPKGQPLGAVRETRAEIERRGWALRVELDHRFDG